MTYRHHFRQWLDTTPGPWTLGQLHILPEANAYRLVHVDDAGRLEELKPIQNTEEWRKTIFYNDKGSFRPLKAAPDFPHGWQYGPLDFDALLLALQFAYPAAIAEWAADRDGTLAVTPWQETAERQSGRFNIVAKLDAAQQEQLVRENCAAACAKHRLWAPGCGIANPPRPAAPATLPLLCPEACNYLVGKAREILKGPMD